MGHNETHSNGHGEARVRADEAFARIATIHAAGGPTEADDPVLDGAMRELAALLAAGHVSREELDERIRSLGPEYLDGTIQGRAFQQLFGYAGDFLTIDRIYQRSHGDESSCRRWDGHFHRQAAPRAVRNRKAYFLDLVRQVEDRSEGVVRVLNLGSGPCRDVLEYFERHPDSRVRFTCVDQDPRAIDHARVVCAAHLDRIELVQANVLRFRTEQRFDLVWSAGVLDYLDDRRAAGLIRRMGNHAAPGGELCVGNFAHDNPSRAYMEVLGRWHLHHRSESELVRLARASGSELMDVAVEREPQGVNLFLRAWLRALLTVDSATDRD